MLALPKFWKTIGLSEGKHKLSVCSFFITGLKHAWASHYICKPIFGPLGLSQQGPCVIGYKALENVQERGKNTRAGNFGELIVSFVFIMLNLEELCVLI